MKKRKNKNGIHDFTVTFVLLLLAGIGYQTLRRQKQPSKAQFINLKHLPQEFHSHGIDLSKYQNDIDWDVFFKQADTTISFIYCKATEGKSLVDSHYKKNTNELRKHQKKYGVYHFFVPSTDAQNQAEHFLNNYTYEPGNLPPVLDVETQSIPDSVLIERMKIWLTIVEKETGVRPIIYTSYHFYTTKFRNTFLSYQFWIAKYGSYVKELNDKRVIYWQYSDAGGIPGIDGPVDLNFSKRTF